MPPQTGAEPDYPLLSQVELPADRHDRYHQPTRVPIEGNQQGLENTLR